MAGSAVTMQKLLTKSYFLLWTIYFFLFWRKAIFFDQSANLVAGHVNIWGDWAAHLTMANAMAARSLILPLSPFLLNARFSYPFVADLISAILLKLNLSLISSFILPSFLLSVFLVLILFYFYKILFKSEKIAILASLIFLLNGGLGFYFWGQDILNSKQPLLDIINPTHEYTRLDAQHLKWINVIDSMIIPQRAFLLGFPLALLALILIYKNFFININKKINHLEIIAASIILGLMPIIHTHSFLACFIILSFWAINAVIFNKNKIYIFKKILIILIITSPIALLLLKKYFLGHVNQDFIKFYPGWLATDFGLNVINFWFKNWFLTPLLALLGFLILIYKNKINFLLFFNFIFIFILANLFLFQPFAWDNTKLIIWASLGFSGLAAYLFNFLFKKLKKDFCCQVIITIVFLLTILSGCLDAYWILKHQQHNYILYSQEELELAEWVKNNTDPNSIWLTGDKHNHFLFNLTGRQAVLTYRGWLWTHGYDYSQIEENVKKIWQEPINNLDLIYDYHINYIIIGYNEIHDWHANLSEFEENFKLIKKTANYQIYQINI